jgi:hypothetical protein
MNDYRRAKRRRAAEAIDVIDTMTELAIGRIGNISETGMLMLAGVETVDDALYQLRFRLQDARGRQRQLEVGAHQLWSDAANVAGQSWCGFRFIEIGSDDAAFLREWIDEPGGEYV